MMKNTNQAVAYGFDALGYIAEPPGARWPTTWSVVMDVTNRILYFRDMDNQQIRYIQLDNVDFSEDIPLKTLKLNSESIGNVLNDFKVP